MFNYAEKTTVKTQYLNAEALLRGDRRNVQKLDLLIIISREAVVYGSGSLSSGPSVLASYLESHGHSVFILDNNSAYTEYSDKKILQLIGDNKIGVVGFSVNMLNAASSYKLAKKIKEKFPKQIVCAGGLHTFDEPEEVGKQSFDISFVGEAEISLNKFLKLAKKEEGPIDSSLFGDTKFIDSLKLIPGIIINFENKLLNTGPYEIIKDLDELPIINHELFNVKDFILTKTDHHTVTTSLNFQRGCPFKCTYCKADFMGGKLRSNSADYMIQTIKHVHEKYGQTHFTLTDSNFTVPRPRLIEFANKMIETGLSKKVTFWIQTSITASVSDENLQLLKKAGLIRISFGVERFTPEFREKMKKVGTQEQVFNVLKKIKENGIMTEINILVNFPYETEKSLEDESKYLLAALPFVDFYRIHYLVPIPGTEMYNSEKVKSRWYLDEKIFYKRTSYYDLAYDINSPGVEFNLFQHSKKVLKKIRKFREKFYKMSLYNMKNFSSAPGRWIFRTLLVMDVFVAKISYFVYNINPTIENIIFWPLKMIRINAVKYVISIWFNPASSKKKKQESDLISKAEPKKI